MNVLCSLIIWVGLSACRNRSSEKNEIITLPQKTEIKTTAVADTTKLPIHAIDSDQLLRLKIDSLGAIVKNGLPTTLHSWDDFYKRERLSMKYIQACGWLGDYYAEQYKAGKLPNLDKALNYYKRVIYLTDGTDADLADDNSSIDRNRVCYRVAQLCKEGKLDVIKLKSKYVGFFVDPQPLDLHNSFNGTLSDSIDVIISFCPGNSKMSPDAKAVLKTIASLIKNSTARVLVSGNCKSWSLDQQISWAQSNTILGYFVDECDIPRERFIQRYDGNGPSNQVYVRLARVGEDGSSNVPPPHPTFDSFPTKYYR